MLTRPDYITPGVKHTGMKKTTMEKRQASGDLADSGLPGRGKPYISRPPVGITNLATSNSDLTNCSQMVTPVSENGAVTPTAQPKNANVYIFCSNVLRRYMVFPNPAILLKQVIKWQYLRRVTSKCSPLRSHVDMPVV